jgi:hypothetical protein
MPPHRRTVPGFQGNNVLETRSVEVGRVTGAARSIEADRKASAGHTRLPPRQPPVTATEAPKRPDGPPYAPLYVIRFEGEVDSRHISAIRKQWEEAFAPETAPRLIVLGGGARLELANAPIVGIRD